MPDRHDADVDRVSADSMALVPWTRGHTWQIQTANLLSAESPYDRAYVRGADTLVRGDRTLFDLVTPIESTVVLDLGGQHCAFDAAALNAALSSDDGMIMLDGRIWCVTPIDQSAIKTIADNAGTLLRASGGWIMGNAGHDAGVLKGMKHIKDSLDAMRASDPSVPRVFIVFDDRWPAQAAVSTAGRP